MCASATTMSYCREKEEVGRRKESQDEEEFFSVLPQEFRIMLTHIKSLSYFDGPDYELLNNVFLQSMNRLGKYYHFLPLFCAHILLVCITNIYMNERPMF